MKKYIRCHIVEAEPMTRGEHLKSKGLALIPGSGSESDEGYFIQYPDGYKSWCPKAQFEEASSPEALYEVLKAFHDEHYAANPEGLTLELVKAYYGQFVHNPCMTFGQAIEAMKQGKKVARRGWNGKGMFLWLKPATSIKAEWCKDEMLKGLVEANGGEILGLGTVCMYTHDSTGRKAILTGWLASQSDMLSDDWVVVE